MNKNEVKSLADVVVEMRVSKKERKQIKDNQKDIKRTIGEIHIGLFGDPKKKDDTGIKGAVLLNTLFRLSGQKLFWIIITAVVLSIAGAIFTAIQARNAMMLLNAEPQSIELKYNQND